MPNYTLTWDTSQVGAFADRGLEKALFRAVSKAGRDAQRLMKSSSSRYVRSKKRFKISRLNAALPLSRATGAREIEDLEWTMQVDGDPTPVADFPYRATGKGISVVINTGKRVLIKSAFEARMKSGHEGIFRREGRARLPIKELFTTRVSQVFHDAGMIPSLFARANAEFGRTFGRVLPLELDALKRAV